MRRFVEEHSLAIVMAILFALALGGQAVAGMGAYNEQQEEHGGRSVDLLTYVTTPDFGSALFENWESEFLQMGLFVVLTVALRQKGSPESKPLDGEKGGKPEKSKKGERSSKSSRSLPPHRSGLARRVYEHSLSLALFGLFAVSFALHVVTSAAKTSEQDVAHGQPPVTALEHLVSPTLWFESFQNWQSEFMSIAALAVLAVFLREKGSPESKDVDAPNDETGG
jgi:hypothetical protein